MAHQRLHSPAHSPKWANMPPRGFKEAPKLLFKNAENARTIRPKRSQASGWHAKRPDMQFVLCFTAQTGPGARLPPVFTATFWGSQGAPGRAPRGLHEASLQPCPHEAPKEAPKRPQEAPKRPPRGPQEATKGPPRGNQEATKRPPNAHSCSHMLTYEHTCSHMRDRLLADLYTRAHLCSYIHTCLHMFTHVHACAHMFTHVHTCSHMFTHVQTCSHTLTHAHTCAHMLTHVHACLHMFTRAPHENALPVPSSHRFLPPLVLAVFYSGF